MRRATSHVVLSAGICLLMSACGSTVANNGQGGTALQQGGTGGLGAAPGASAPGNNGLGGPPLAGSGGGTTGGATGATGGSLGSTGGTSGTTGFGTTGTTGATGGGTTGPSTAVGPGVTATSIYLGIPYCTDCAQANAALTGNAGQDPGDEREYYKVAINDVNSRGGVLGRKLVPVFHAVSASDNIDTSAQAACETFTKDNKVLIMYLRGQIAYECARKAGIIVDGGGSSTGPVYAKYPNLFDSAAIRLERLGAVTVKAMVRSGWQKPAAPKWPTGKIGLMAWDETDYRYAMKAGYLPALHAAGLKETDVRYVAVPQSDKSIADASAAVSSAVLKFQQEGIDHVFIADGPAGIFKGGGLTFLFLNTAESQGYRPRYGFNSNNFPGSSNYQAAQESGMLAIDGFDAAQTNDEGIALNPQRERCWAMMKKAGRNVSDEATQTTALNACATAWFAEALLKRAGGTTLSTLIAGGEALGTSYRSPFVYGTRLAPGQHDGMALFRNSQFDDGCACMKYTSKPYEP